MPSFLFAFLRKVVGVAQMWQPAWGPPPTADEINHAHRFVDGLRAHVVGEVNVCERFVKSSVPLGALYLVDRSAVREVFLSSLGVHAFLVPRIQELLHGGGHELLFRMYGEFCLMDPEATQEDPQAAYTYCRLLLESLFFTDRADRHFYHEFLARTQGYAPFIHMLTHPRVQRIAFESGFGGVLSEATIYVARRAKDANVPIWTDLREYAKQCIREEGPELAVEISGRGPDDSGGQAQALAPPNVTEALSKVDPTRRPLDGPEDIDRKTRKFLEDMGPEERRVSEESAADFIKEMGFLDDSIAGFETPVPLTALLLFLQKYARFEIKLMLRGTDSNRQRYHNFEILLQDLDFFPGYLYTLQRILDRNVAQEYWDFMMGFSLDALPPNIRGPIEKDSSIAAPVLATLVLPRIAALLNQSPPSLVAGYLEVAGSFSTVVEAMTFGGGFLPPFQICAFLEECFRFLLLDPALDRTTIRRVMPEISPSIRDSIENVLATDPEPSRSGHYCRAVELIDSTWSGKLPFRVLARALSPLVEGVAQFGQPREVPFSVLREQYDSFQRAVDVDTKVGLIASVGRLTQMLGDIRSMAVRQNRIGLLEDRSFQALEMLLHWFTDSIPLLIALSGPPFLRLTTLLPGKATGQLHVVLDENRDRLADIFSRTHRHEIVVIPDALPAADFPLGEIAGLIVGRHIGDHDHAMHRARELGIPLAYLPAASRWLKGWSGITVTLDHGVLRQATESDLPLRLAFERPGSLPWQEQAKAEVPVPVRAISDPRNVISLGVGAEMVPPEVGGTKLSNLSRLIHAGIPVPATRVITAGAFGRFLEQSGILGQIDAMVSSISVTGLWIERIKEPLRQIRHIVLGAQIPESLLAEILMANRSLPGSLRIARASSSLEDLPEWSGAGYYGSHVSPDERLAVLLAIKKAWASYWNLLPFLKRREMKRGEFDFIPAVGLMEYKVGRASGNMIVGGDGLIINAVPGQGKGYAEGIVKPDVIRMDWRDGQFSLVSWSEGHDRMNKVVVREDGTLEVVFLTPEERGRQVITLDDAAWLSKEARAVWELSGGIGRREIEYVIAEDGRYLLQDRPFVESKS